MERRSVCFEIRVASPPVMAVVIGLLRLEVIGIRRTRADSGAHVL